MDGSSYGWPIHLIHIILSIISIEHTLFLLMVKSIHDAYNTTLWLYNMHLAYLLYKRFYISIASQRIMLHVNRFDIISNINLFLKIMTLVKQLDIWFYRIMLGFQPWKLCVRGCWIISFHRWLKNKNSMVKHNKTVINSHEQSNRNAAFVGNLCLILLKFGSV